VTTNRLPTVAASIAGTAVTGLLANVSRSRPRRSDEYRVWRLMLQGVAIIAGAALVGQSLALAPDTALRRPDEIRHLIFSLGCVVGCAWMYQGLVQWHRNRTRLADPSDFLNGLSAVLVLAALGNLTLSRIRPAQHGLASWQLQASVLTCAAAVVVVGTAIWVAALGGLLRDRRIWLITTAMSLISVAEIAALFITDQSSAVTMPAWLFGCALIAACTLISPRPGTPLASANRGTIMGALLVLSVGVALLTVDKGVAERSLAATGYALAGVIGATVRIGRLVQELAHLAQTRHEAMTDELTGIPNRRAFLMAIDKALLSARSASLLIVDLDRFKEVNDRYGHAAGDRLLRHTAEAFAAQIPVGACLSRLGGDEFAVLLTDADTARAPDLALNLAQAAAAPVNDLKGRVLQVGASIGIATVDVPGVSGGELLRQADTAMYQAKTSGSGVRIYDSALDAAAQERLELTEDLRRVLKKPAGKEDQLLLYFQPQLSLNTGAVVGAEALLRWQHPRLGLLGPAVFIDLVEQNGMMPALTECVLREASAQAGRWRANGHRLRVSVNLSAGGLANGSLLPLIDEVIGNGLAAPDLVLEVTETSLMKDPARALEAMRRIAERGVGISIDDYGTGYSSLKYMNDLPATELKIHRCFTTQMTSDPRTAAIVAGTVELAHRLGMRLVAEGVEDDATLAMITELGCDHSQGHLHSPPLSGEDFLGWLDARAASPVRSEPGVPTRV